MAEGESRAGSKGSVDPAIERREKALSYLNNGNYEEAEPLIEAVVQDVEGEKNEHGEVSAQFFLWSRRLAEVYIGQEKYVEAEPHIKKAMKGFELKYGKEDEDTLDCKYFMAEVLYGLGKFPEANVLATEACEGLKDVRGPDHFITLRCKALLSLILNYQYKKAEATEIAKSVAETLDSVTEKVDARVSMGGRRLSEAETVNLRTARAMSKESIKLSEQTGKMSRNPSKGSAKPPSEG
mmetsp:Transcript_67001/g.196620  ORF Transcript_67001/g.196620 Transcript_67001/m.196620 type:complete len:238 (-) Transcript_67001:6-719(-)